MIKSLPPTTPATAIVSGFSSGVGFELARALARQGYKMIGIAQNAEKGRKAIEILKVETGNPALIFYAADLSLMRDVKAVADIIRLKHEKIDVLINNVGAIFQNNCFTEEGLEQTFALNHLGVVGLTLALLPQIEKGRILTITSAAHDGVTLDFSDLQMKQHYNGWQQYRRTKLMNILFTRQLARTLPEGISACAAHPGFVATNFGQNNHLLWRWMMRVMMLAAITPQQSARSLLPILMDQKFSLANGQYFDRSHPTAPSPYAQNSEIEEALWQETLVYLKKFDLESSAEKELAPADTKIPLDTTHREIQLEPIAS